MIVNATFSKDEIARLQELSSGAGHPLNEKELDDVLAACTIALLYVSHITVRTPLALLASAPGEIY